MEKNLIFQTFRLPFDASITNNQSQPARMYPPKDTILRLRRFVGDLHVFLTFPISFDYLLIEHV
jgi:hypothetical protein